MQRAQQTVRRQLETGRDMNTVSQMFGWFVPKAVADSMIRNKGALDPVERQATVLFADLADFTKLTEAKGPRAIVDILNAYFDAASGLLEAVRTETFAGERLAIRISLNSGPLIAGNDGGGGRQSYTVHGDAVNLAARLENLNKEHGTSLLVSQSTAGLVTNGGLTKIGETEIRGLSEPIGL